MTSTLSTINLVLTGTSACLANETLLHQLVRQSDYFLSASDLINLFRLERCLHAILASRAILHMRNHVRRQVEWELTELSAGHEVDDAAPLPDGRIILIKPVP